MPQSARLSAGGGSNGYLGNAQMNRDFPSVGLPLSALHLALNMRAGAGWFLRHGRPGNIINYFLLQMHPRQGTQTKGTGLLKALQPTMQHDGTIYGRISPD